MARKRIEARIEGQSNVEVVPVVRTYYSISHYRSALHQAQLAENLEKCPQDSMDALNHRSHVVAGMIAAACFMEAAVNEILLDAAEGEQRVVASLGDVKAELLGVYYRESGNGFAGTLEKYQMTAMLASSSVFNKGGSPYQDAKLLIDLRNKLVHARPAWGNSETKHRVGDALARKCGLWPAKKDLENPTFPDKVLWSEALRWSARSARAMVEELHSRIGLPMLPYERTPSS